MENIRISLSESGHDRDISEIRVDGVIDTMTATELEEVFDTLLRRNRYRIVVDLAGVDYISSAGWGIFISHIKDVRSSQGDIKLSGMVADVHEIFELLEFDRILKVYASVDEAIGDFGPGPGSQGEKKKDRDTAPDRR
ncbi:MAG: STAS domain-containing protein [candidate division Zixibacteria bacterium]|nr:STAS domain-containing protein [candidate division Zixibacteria bacterium]